LERGRDAEAQSALDRADVPAGWGGWLEGEQSLLTAWVEVRRGRFDGAFKRLNRSVPHRSSAEGFLLLAIAAEKTGHAEEYEKAIKHARERGADLTQIRAGPPSGALAGEAGRVRVGSVRAGSG
jgi:hypothetical protein